MNKKNHEGQEELPQTKVSWIERIVVISFLLSGTEALLSILDRIIKV